MLTPDIVIAVSFAIATAITTVIDIVTAICNF